MACPAQFTREADRSQHRKDCKAMKEDLKCIKCNAPFKALKSLKPHYLECRGPNPSCEFCDRVFSTTATLKRHQKNNCRGLDARTASSGSVESQSISGQSSEPETKEVKVRTRKIITLF